MSSASKIRLDQALVEQGLLPTLTLARSWIMAGHVQVNQQRVDKPGTWVKLTDGITLKPIPQYVSRGGEKLAHALAAFKLSLQPGSVCLDVGASTGGFTDCLLQAGARHVVALDVGTNQLDWRLRHNDRVTSMEQTHIRDFDRHQLMFDDPTLQVIDGFDWIVADVSFISLMSVMPSMLTHLKPYTGQLITLLKPQFEFARYRGVQPHFNGVVSQPDDLAAILSGFYAEAQQLSGCVLKAMAVSPITGAKGNTEYLLWWTTV